MIDPKVLASALNAAKLAASIVPLGGPAMLAGRALLELVTDIADTSDPTPDQVVALEAGRVELERAVNAHADRTAASLGDG